MLILKLQDITTTPYQTVPLAVEEDLAYCVHKFDGNDVLKFELQRTHDAYKKIFEEVTVEGFNNRFVVKKIDEHSDFVFVTCEVDCNDWKKTVFKDFRKTNEIIDNVINEILPTGWTIIYGTGVDQTKRTTVEESQGQAFRAAVAWDILDAIRIAYGVVFNFDVPLKILYVINPESYVVSGEFIMEDLNLTDLGFNGDSSNFITRLYPYGKKNESSGEYVSVKSVNNGREYIDNNQYSSKVICGTWVDERYTVPQSLYDDAVEKLAELSKPIRSYTCNVINFNEDMWLYKVVTLIDKNREQRVNHQIVEFTEYKNHRLDKCTLASKTPDIVKIIKDSVKTFEEQERRIKDDMQEFIEAETQRLSDKITGSNGGHFKWILDADGNPEELVNLYDTDDITTAQKVWRWNAGGLGHSNNGYNGTYDLALTKDGEINASMITTGILNAGLIKAGVLQGGGTSGNPNFKLVMSTGELTMRNGSININDEFIVDSSGNATLNNVNAFGKFISQSTTERVVVDQALIRGYHRQSVQSQWPSTATGTLDLSADYLDDNNTIIHEAALTSSRNLHLGAVSGKEILFEIDRGVIINVNQNGLYGELHHTLGANETVYLPLEMDASGIVNRWAPFNIVDGIVR